MNKNELKNGEIYVAGKSMTFINKEGTNKSIEYSNITKPIFCKNAVFSYENMRKATSEEKHWLETCIELDKFIEYEEAMKTFIPEYVECSDPNGWKFTINNNNNNLIFDTKKELTTLNNTWKKIFSDNRKFSFKTSTKKAYDAQFKTKEVVKVKPFEILETCRKNPNKIKQVINEEGNIFMIDDIITPTIADSINKGKGFKITGFRLNKDKSMICAITDTHAPYGIGIDKIEHFIEKDEFVLPELWHIVITKGNYKTLSLYFQKYLGHTSSNILCKEGIMGFYRTKTLGHTNSGVRGPGYNFGNEITFKQFKKYVLKEEYKPKVGDKFQINDKWGNYFYIITRIIDCKNSYCQFKNEDGYNCGTVLLKNITIIK